MKKSSHIRYMRKYKIQKYLFYQQEIDKKYMLLNKKILFSPYIDGPYVFFFMPFIFCFPTCRWNFEFLGGRGKNGKGVITSLIRLVRTFKYHFWKVKKWDQNFDCRPKKYISIFTKNVQSQTFFRGSKLLKYFLKKSISSFKKKIMFLSPSVIYLACK